MTKAADAPKRNFFFRNRGILLDLFVFLMNLLLARYLVHGFTEIWNQADSGSTTAKVIIFAMFAGMLLLLPIATILKRWQRHQNLGVIGSLVIAVLSSRMFYFVLTYGVFIKLLGLTLEFLDSFGVSDDTSGNVFVWGIFIGLAFSYISSGIVSSYFDPPASDPPFAFLKSPRSELLGDACLWLNMVFFQVVWGWIIALQLDEYSTTNDQDPYGRLGRLLLLALFVYFPPRVIYLAEDFKKPLAWVTIVLANLPIIYRFWAGSIGGHG